ncbi:MAG: SCO family protein [Acidobacteriia bacterium]|nr:SCO family protein [Terriglobia bacterium]
MRRSISAMIAAAAPLVLLYAGLARAATWGANYFPNVPLTTQEGKTVRFYDDLLKGKRVVIDFIYTKCGDSCPLETARLAQVHRLLGDRMGRDIFFYSISIDPVRDTPAELKAYAESYRAGPGWLFLTGKKADIEAIRKKLGQAARAGENELTDHSTSFTIGNEATGQWMRDSSTDDPHYLAAIIGDWMGDWKNRVPGQSYAEKPELPASAADRGANLFRTRCAACHSIGEGDGVGPDLAGVTRVRKREWLAGMIALPNEMLAKGDPIATALFAQYRQVRMPNLRLGDVDVNALLGYLEARDAAGASGGKDGK